jgi:hypothetical protein
VVLVVGVVAGDVEVVVTVVRGDVVDVVVADVVVGASVSPAVTGSDVSPIGCETSVLAA